MNVHIYRNQATRTAQFLWQEQKGALVVYAMPQGALYFNILPDIKNPHLYSTITFEKVVNTESEENLTKVLNLLEDHLEELLFDSQHGYKRQWKLRGAVALTKRRIEFVKSKQPSII